MAAADVITWEMNGFSIEVPIGQRRSIALHLNLLYIGNYHTFIQA